MRARRAAADHRRTSATRSAEVVDARTAGLPERGPRRARLLGVARRRCERGVAAHHAGLLPAFKETVEELFVRGLVRAVFATETLALGINMPARTVVLEKLVKFNGEAHVDLTPGEYTQLTGRAGPARHRRRGPRGRAVAARRRPDAGRRASPRPAPTRCARRSGPSLQHGRQPGRPARRGHGPRAARVVVRPVPGRPRRSSGWPAQIDRNNEALAELRRADGLPPRRLRRVHGRCAARLRDREKSLARQNSASAAGRGGRVAGGAAQGRRDRGARPAGGPGWRSVVDPGRRIRWCVTEDRWAGRLSVADFPARSSRWAGCGCPSRSTCARRRRAATSPPACATPASTCPRGNAAAPAPADDAELAALRRALRAAPVPRLRGARGPRPLGRALLPAGGRHRADPAEGRGDDALAGPHVRPDPPPAHRTRLPGRRRRPGHPARSTAGPALLRDRTCWSPSACARRSGSASARPNWPRWCRRWCSRRAGSRRWTRGCRTARWPTRCSRPCDVGFAGGRRGQAQALDRTREPDAGFAWPIFRWTRGEALEKVLLAAETNGQELGAGDFVRWCRQVVDLLDQIREVRRRERSGRDHRRSRGDRDPARAWSPWA